MGRCEGGLHLGRTAAVVPLGQFATTGCSLPRAGSGAEAGAHPGATGDTAEGTSVVSQTSKWFSGSQFHYVWFDFFFDSLRMGLPPSFVWMCMTSRS